MIPVKTLPRFKCEFCKIRGTKSRMEKHEKSCYRNPNRICYLCQNSGNITEWYDNPYGGQEQHTVECPACLKFDEDKLKEIQAREEGEKKPLAKTNNDDLSF